MVSEPETISDSGDSSSSTDSLDFESERKRPKSLQTLSDPLVEPKSNEKEDDDDAPDDECCSICLESWTSTGNHRICSLRCGHLFGLMYASLHHPHSTRYIVALKSG